MHPILRRVLRVIRRRRFEVDLAEEMEIHRATKEEHEPGHSLHRPGAPAVERGRELAMRRCAECHAVRRGSDSPDGDAPPFSTLRLRFNELSLERRLAGIPWGEHAGMPPIGLTSGDRSDLAAYIESLK